MPQSRRASLSALSSRSALPSDPPMTSHQVHPLTFPTSHLEPEGTTSLSRIITLYNHHSSALHTLNLDPPTTSLILESFHRKLRRFSALDLSLASSHAASDAPSRRVSQPRRSAGERDLLRGGHLESVLATRLSEDDPASARVIKHHCTKYLAGMSRAEWGLVHSMAELVRENQRGIERGIMSEEGVERGSQSDPEASEGSRSEYRWRSGGMKGRLKQGPWGGFEGVSDGVSGGESRSELTEGSSPPSTLASGERSPSVVSDPDHRPASDSRVYAGPGGISTPPLSGAFTSPSGASAAPPEYSPRAHPTGSSETPSADPTSVSPISPTSTLPSPTESAPGTIGEEQSLSELDGDSRSAPLPHIQVHPPEGVFELDSAPLEPRSELDSSSAHRAKVASDPPSFDSSALKSDLCPRRIARKPLYNTAAQSRTDRSIISQFLSPGIQSRLRPECPGTNPTAGPQTHRSSVHTTPRGDNLSASPLPEMLVCHCRDQRSKVSEPDFRSLSHRISSQNWILPRNPIPAHSAVSRDPTQIERSLRSAWFDSKLGEILRGAGAIRTGGVLSDREMGSSTAWNEMMRGAGRGNLTEFMHGLETATRTSADRSRIPMLDGLISDLQSVREEWASNVDWVR